MASYSPKYKGWRRKISRSLHSFNLNVVRLTYLAIASIFAVLILGVLGLSPVFMTLSWKHGEFPTPQVYDPVFIPIRQFGSLSHLLNSAFFDSRPKLHPGKDYRLEIITMKRFFKMGEPKPHDHTNNNHGDYFCQMKFRNGMISQIPATEFLIKEHNLRPFAVTLYWCDLPDFEKQKQKLCRVSNRQNWSLSRDPCWRELVPERVSILPKIQGEHEIKWLNVSVTSEMLDLVDSFSKEEKTFAAEATLAGDVKEIRICTSPIRGSLYDTFMPHWLEYYRRVGINKFIMYNAHPSDQTLDIMKRYEDKAIVEIVSFNVPTCSSLNVFIANDKVPLPLTCRTADNLVHDYGQLASQADCILRTAGKAQWTLIIDLDEFLVPQVSESTIPEVLVKQLQMFSKEDLSVSSGHFWGFHFNSFFYKACNADFNSELLAFSRPLQLTLNHFSAFAAINKQEPTEGFGRRCKIILDPLLVDVMGIHLPFVVLPDTDTPPLDMRVQDSRWEESKVALYNRWSVRYDHQGKTKMQRLNRANSYLDRYIFVHPDSVHIHHVRSKGVTMCNSAGEWKGKNVIENRRLWMLNGSEILQEVAKFYQSNENYQDTFNSNS